MGIMMMILQVVVVTIMMMILQVVVVVDIMMMILQVVVVVLDIMMIILQVVVLDIMMMILQVVVVMMMMMSHYRIPPPLLGLISMMTPVDRPVHCHMTTLPNPPILYHMMIMTIIS